MGGKKAGGGARTPYEAPTTLSSAQTLRIVDVISEGVVSGFANGDDAPRASFLMTRLFKTVMALITLKGLLLGSSVGHPTSLTSRDGRQQSELLPSLLR